MHRQSLAQTSGQAFSVLGEETRNPPPLQCAAASKSTPRPHFTPETRSSGPPPDHPLLLLLGAPLLLVPHPCPCPVPMSPAQPGWLLFLQSPFGDAPGSQLCTLWPTPSILTSRFVQLGAQEPLPMQPNQAPFPSSLRSSPISKQGKSSRQALSPKPDVSSAPASHPI